MARSAVGGSASEDVAAEVGAVAHADELVRQHCVMHHNGNNA